MIISRLRYEALLDQISKLENDIKVRDQYIENLRNDVKAITRDRDTMLNIIKGTNPFNIDYPDTKGVNVANTHLDSIDRTSNYPAQRHNDGTQFFRF